MTKFADVAQGLKAKTIVELGCGDGRNAANIMEILPLDGRLFTVNWTNPPSGDNPLRYLSTWINDSRLTLIYGDTRDPLVVQKIPSNIDLLIIDSTHTNECASEEWRLYSPKLVYGAAVLVDDLDHNDMMDFWNGLSEPIKFTAIDNGRKVGFIAYSRK